jgi:NADH-quinone oxidoreductase subunit H
MIWVRWTLPRLRIDQVMTTCLKYCTPIAAVMFLGAAAWQYWLPQRNFFGLTRTPLAVYGINEGWPADAEMADAAEGAGKGAPAEDQPPDEVVGEEDQTVSAPTGAAALVAQTAGRRSE